MLPQLQKLIKKKKNNQIHGIIPGDSESAGLG